MVVYWRGGQTQLEGLLLGVALRRRRHRAGALGQRAHALVAPSSRNANDSSATPDEVGGVARRPRSPRRHQAAHVLRRPWWWRRAAIGAAALFPLRSLGPKPGGSLLHTAWASRSCGSSPSTATVVRADDVPLDGLLTVFPEGDPGLVGRPGGHDAGRRPTSCGLPRSAWVWTVDGIVAFSKVCTHAGCPVGLYEADYPPAAVPVPPVGVRRAGRGQARERTGSVAAAAAPPDVSTPTASCGPHGDFSEPVGPGWWTYVTRRSWLVAAGSLVSGRVRGGAFGARPPLAAGRATSAGLWWLMFGLPRSSTSSSPAWSSRRGPPPAPRALGRESHATA